MRAGTHRLSLLWATALILIAGQAGAQTKPADPGLLSLDRIFSSREFAAERFGPARWMADGDSYTTLEPADGGGPGRDLVLYRAESGKREILVAAARLVAPGASEPIAIEDYAWSPDGKVLIVMTNSRRVWRQNTRGDFWTYELASGRLRTLGPGFEPSTLMFAKLSTIGSIRAVSARLSARGLT
jgi:dipeptidyl-peptidase-4